MKNTSSGNSFFIKGPFFLILLFISIHGFSQQILTPASVKTLPGAKCYWSYSVRRTKTSDSTNHYTVAVSLSQYDSTGKSSGLIEINHAIIFCEFKDRDGKSRRTICKHKGKYWIAKFVVHTNKIIPVNLIAQYNKQERTMPFTLNTGIYPGEDNVSID